MRKTFDVESLLRKTNAALAAPGSTPDGREALAAMLENVLMETGNYAGFRYLENPDPSKPVEGMGSRVEYFWKG